MATSEVTRKDLLEAVKEMAPEEFNSFMKRAHTNKNKQAVGGGNKAHQKNQSWTSRQIE